MYGTTALFLENIGINSLSDLPDLGEFVPTTDIVEALEHGLRFDDDLVEVSADDEAVIDLRDSAEGE